MNTDRETSTIVRIAYAIFFMLLALVGGVLVVAGMIAWGAVNG